MTKSVSFCLVFFLAQITFSQDIIHLNNGTKIEAKIVEITSTSIRYYKFSHLESPIRMVEKYEVSKIVDQNGETEKFDALEQVTLSSQTSVEKPGRAEKPFKDPVMQRGFFIDGLIGIAEHKSYKPGKSNDPIGFASPWASNNQTTIAPVTAFNIGMRLGHKWYFGKRTKWRPGFQATWFRLDVLMRQGIDKNLIRGPRTLAIANIGMCNIFKLSEKVAVEANLTLGPTLNSEYKNFIASSGYSISLESKLRLKGFSLGIDYQYSYLLNDRNSFADNGITVSKRGAIVNSLCLTVGIKL